jgi:putative ABC transport system ATP-binding protein
MGAFENPFGLELRSMGKTDLVEIQGLKKSYRLGETEVPALRGVNLNIQRGEFTALIGSSGSGKTTLLNMIGCIDTPNAGQIRIGGVSVAHLSENERSDFRNRTVGLIFQTFNLLPVLNVFENIELPLVINKEISEKERRDRARAAMTEVGLEKFADHVPDQLSGGQRQRVAIARALTARPQLILADEPTANLDSETAHKILDLMQELNRKHQMTFLFCTHDEKLMGRVSRIVRIRDGLIESGSLTT